MNKKVIGILIIMLFIATTVLPASASINKQNKQTLLLESEPTTGEFGVVFVVAIIDGYEEHEEYLEVHYKFGWITGFYLYGNLNFQLGSVPIIGGESYWKKDAFRGIITQNFICGFLIGEF